MSSVYELGACLKLNGLKTKLGQVWRYGPTQGGIERNERHINGIRSMLLTLYSSSFLKTTICTIRASAWVSNGGIIRTSERGHQPHLTVLDALNVGLVGSKSLTNVGFNGILTMQHST